MNRLLVGCGFCLCIILSVLQESRAQNLELTNADNFRNCVEGDDSDFKVVITPVSDETSFKENSFSLDWGDGSEILKNISYADLNTQHIYTNWGVFRLTVSAVSKQTGQTVIKTYDVVNLSKPAIGFEKTASGIPCVNSEAEIFITGFNANTANTTYRLDFGDGQTKEYTQSQVKDSQGKILHTYTKTHCQLGHPEGITIRVTARNECAFENAMEYPEYVIILPPTADFAYQDKPGCTEKEVRFFNRTEEGLGKNCEPLHLKYEWDFGKEGVGTDQTNVENPVVVYDEAGNYQVTLSITNTKGFRCANVTKTLPVEIIKHVEADFDIPFDEDCDPVNGLVFTDQSSGDRREYQWSVAGQVAVGGYQPVGSMTAGNAKINFAYGTYRVTQKVWNNCSSDSKDTTILVKKDPEIVKFDALDAICPGDVLTLSAQKIRYVWYNNENKLLWKVEPASGWTLEAGSQLTNEYPKIRFTTPGDYKLTVTLTGVDCGGTQLTASQTLKVYHPEVDVNGMLADRTEMCEGEVMTVEGKPLGEIRNVNWEVVKGNTLMVIQPIEEGNKHRFTIPDYGNYRVKASVAGACRTVDKEFAVRVYRAPEIVTLTGFPAYQCPKDEFYPGVDINYNGNEPESVGLRWEVLENGVVSDKATVIGDDTPTPKIRFTDHGHFEIRLTLTPGTACGPRDKLVASEMLDVVDPQLDMHIQADQTEVCVNGVMTFTNTTSAVVTPAYSWSVTPGTDGVDYEFTGGTGATDPSPKIRFKTSGIYNVNGFIQGACDGKSFPFPIVVKQDPEVTIDAIDPICPGELTLNETVVHYNWNDNWKGDITWRKVEWSLLTKPENADFTPYTSPEWDNFYPHLELKTPGTYVLQAKLTSVANCGGVLTATQSVTVYNPDITVEISPRTDVNVKSLGGDTWQALQGEPMGIENKSDGVGLTYQWSVVPAENVTISDATAKEPQITFRKHGTYRVRAAIIGTCNVAEKEFTVIVRGVPDFVLDPLPDRCDNAVDVLDLQKYLHCDSAGNSVIQCHWTITPADGSWTPVEGTALTDMMPKLKFSKNGIYTLTLAATAEYGGERSYTGQLRVFRYEVSADALLSATAGCTTDEAAGMPLTMTNKAVGDSLEWTWSVMPETGWNGNLTLKNPQLRFTEQGNYIVSLQVKNICGEAQKEYDFRAYAKPDVETLTAENLGRQCDLDYYFKAADHVGAIETHNDALQHVLWKVGPAGGDFLHETTPQDEYPDIRLTGDQSYTITGEFANHCRDTVRVHFAVQMDRFEKVDLTSVDPMCAMSDSVLLQATPEGGEWSVRETGMLTQSESGKYYFHPNRNEELVVWAYYAKGNGTCYDRDSIKLKIRQLPAVDAGPDIDQCLNGESYELQGMIPENLSAWTGDGVVDQKWFNPQLAGEGRIRLEYHYTDPATLCSNLDTLFVTVHGLPATTFGVSGLQCQGIDSLFTPTELGQGHRFVWDFGNGTVREGGDSAYVYQYPVSGNYQVQLTTISKYECKVVGEPVTIEVLDLPPTAGFTVVPADTAGCGPHPVTPVIESDIFAADHLRLSYFWDYGNGTSSTELQPATSTYQPTLFDTTYRILFRVYNVCGESLDTADIGVWSAAVAHFTVNPDRPDGFCTPAEPFFINGSTGTGNTYTWDFADLGTSHAVDTSYTFTTGNKTTDFTVMLTAVNRCNTEGSKAAYTLKVKPNPIVAGFTMSQKYLCAGDTVYFVNNSVDRDPESDKMLLYEWNFGDGEIAGVWDTCHQYRTPGAYGITLKLDNGCARRTFTDSVFVHVLPVLHLEEAGPICEDLALDFVASSEEPLKNIVWDFGDGSAHERGVFRLSHAFEEPGIYEVRVWGEASQIPACPGEAMTTVEIRSNPRVKILPLDTMACSPLEFQPEIEATGYDYFKWDYGDGTALTSETGHTYRNDTNFIVEYHLTAYVENNWGCREEHQGTIKVYNAPKAAWDKEISYGRPEKVRFINLSKDYTECIWYLPDGRVVNSPDDQMMTFEDENTYPMALTVINEYGCRDSLYEDYRSYKGGLYFPNTFIPHSSNPKVSHFTGIGMGLKEYRLEIFDLYGNKLWETEALIMGEPAEGWDGCNKDGKPMPQGVYIWRAKAVFFSEDVWTGDNNRSGKAQSTQGSVLLLRE